VGAASFPAHEQAAESIVPGVGPFDDPASRLPADLSDQRLLAAAPNMRTDTAQANGRRHVRVVVALVETEVLRTTRATRTANDDRVEHFADHGAVGHVRAADERGDWDTAPVGQNVALYAAFRPVRRVRPREVPPFGAFTEALSSELHFHAIPRRPS
jgi:hypothetical protein